MPRFLSDDYFDLATSKTPLGTSIRITGDIVVIDKQRLTSILSDPAYPKTGIVSLVFDAREIVLNGPISLEGGSISLLAETVRVGKGGRVTLSPANGDATRSFTLMAERLLFDKAAKRPFDVNLSASENVDVKLRVGQAPGGSSAALWAKFVDAVELELPTNRFSLLYGQAAREEIAAQFATSVEWPLYFAAKVRRHFNRDPFNKVTNADLSGIIATYRPMMNTWRDPRPYSVISSVDAALRNETDLEGRLYSFTPKENLLSQKASLNGELSSASFNELVEILSVTDVPKPQLEALLLNTRSELQVADQKLSALSSEIDTSNNLLQQLTQAANGIDVRIGQRTEYLQTLQAQEFEKLKKAQQIRQWTTVAASAVVIAASMGAATPAVAAGATTGISLIGEAAANRNAGTPIKIEAVIQQGAATYAAAVKFRESWDSIKSNQGKLSALYRGEVIMDGPAPAAGKPDERKPLTKNQAAKKLAESLGEAVKNIQAINGGQLAFPTPLSLTDRQNEDEEFKALLAERAANQQASSLAVADLSADTIALEALLNSRSELQALDYALREAAPTNDQETARWKANASLLWGMNVQRISSMLNTYRKSLYFETGMIPTGPANIVDYPNELESKVALNIFNPAGSVEPAAQVSARRDQLTFEKAKFLASARSAVQSVDDTYNKYLNSRNEADVYRKAILLSANSPNKEIRAFFQALNGQISQQIAGGSATSDLLPIFIPYVLPKSINKYPERLLRATVTKVSFNVPTKNIGSNGIAFVIIHPGYGVMRRGLECYVADLRNDPTDWRSFNVPVEQITPDWLTRDPTKVMISKTDSDRFYTYLPARSPYHIVASVISNRWATIPQVTSIEIGFEVMQ